MSPMASQITNVSNVCSIVCSGKDQRKHQRYALLAFVRGATGRFPILKLLQRGNCFDWMTSSWENIYLRQNHFTQWLISHTNPITHNKQTHWSVEDLAKIFEMQLLNFVSLIGILKSSYDNALKWMPQNFTDDQSIWIQVIAWYHQNFTDDQSISIQVIAWYRQTSS